MCASRLLVTLVLLGAFEGGMSRVPAFAQAAGGGQSAQSDDKSPTLEETLQFIKDKLTAATARSEFSGWFYTYGYVAGVRYVHFRTTRAEVYTSNYEVSFSKCTLTTTQTDTRENITTVQDVTNHEPTNRTTDNSTVWFKDVIHLDNLSSEQIDLSTNAWYPHGWVRSQVGEITYPGQSYTMLGLHAKGRAPASERSTNQGNAPGQAFALDSTLIIVADDGLSARLQKAFAHAITLCAGKEPF
jgi:hypothetical protein